MARLKVGFARRLPVDSRPIITCGEMGENNKPKRFDYFDISEYPELIAMYGEKPTKLIVLLPTNNMDDSIHFEREKWGAMGKPVKKRFCDGEKCTHRIQETIMGNTYKAGEITACVCSVLGLEEKDGKEILDETTGKKVEDIRCDYGFRLTALVANPQTGKVDSMSCYRFGNHSKNSGTNVISAIENTADYMRMVFGLEEPVLAYIPFELSVVKVESKDDAKKNFPVWNMRCVYTNAKKLADRVVKVARQLRLKSVEEQMLALPQSDEERFDSSLAPPSPSVEMLDVPDVFKKAPEGAERASREERGKIQKLIDEAKSRSDLNKVLLTLRGSREKNLLTDIDYNELADKIDAMTQKFE